MSEWTTLSIKKETKSKLDDLIYLGAEPNFDSLLKTTLNEYLHNHRELKEKLEKIREIREA